MKNIKEKLMIACKNLAKNSEKEILKDFGENSIIIDKKTGKEYPIKVWLKENNRNYSERIYKNKENKIKLLGLYLFNETFNKIFHDEKLENLFIG